MAIIPRATDKTVIILLEVIKGLLNVIDEQNLMIQKMIRRIQEEATDESV